jgi:PPK2 family polyphosphate:nucleotide phosphotransferase
MKIKANEFQVPEGKKVDLKKWRTKVEPFYRSKAEYKGLLKQHKEELSEFQELLYAHNRYSLLVIFQAMDAAGKDSAIEHVMSGVNPQGCQVFSFKHPSAEELDHDFLWRCVRALPERGRIGIFNRSYYEDVLIVRVHPEILQAQNVPDEQLNRKNIWEQRYESIRNLEQHLYLNGTRVIKFFLHISKEEQRRRFIKRIVNPEKNWKFNIADMKERHFWDKYMDAYEACLHHTSTEKAPWHVIPADDKPNARLIISRVIVETLRGLKMEYPKLSREELKELQDLRRVLEQKEI